MKSAANDTRSATTNDASIVSPKQAGRTYANANGINMAKSLAISVHRAGK